MSNILTKYHNVPTSELISSLFDKRQHSPIIEELCQRLEDGDTTDRPDDFNGKVSCPVCETTLDIVDEETHYTVSVTRE